MQTETSSIRTPLLKRLTPYWKMEAANVFILPAITIWAVTRLDDSISGPLILAMIACSSLLVIGAFALRMHLEDVKGNRAFGERVLPWLSAAQWPALVLAAGSLCGAGFERWADGRWSPSAVGAALLATLAVLEYVNYYRVQLQHFDHLADLNRLRSGKGLKEAHLAKALRKYRQRSGGA